MALNLTTSSAIATEMPWGIFLLYGPNGGGKTRFASTFPNPYFLVTELSANEMKTLADEDIPIITFSNITGMAKQVEEFAALVQRGDLPDCNTLVIDNLTSIQLLVEQELKEAGKRTKLEWDDWGKFTSLFTKMMSELNGLPIHVIWITHSKEITVTPAAVGQKPYQLGGFTLTGQSKNIFPNYSDFILYCDSVDKGNYGTEFRVHLKAENIWGSRVRGPKEIVEKLPRHIDNHYDELALLMGWPSQEEVEDGVVSEEDVKEKPPEKPKFKEKGKKKK